MKTTLQIPHPDMQPTSHMRHTGQCANRNPTARKTVSFRSRSPKHAIF
jgi:hypothetical protein